MGRTRQAVLLVLVLLASIVGGVTPAAADPVTVITVGTSIEAGTGHPVGQSWPQRLAARAPGYTFTDMSLAGGAWTAENSAGDSIRKHMQAAVAQHPDVIVVGGPVNDLVSLYDVAPLRWAVFEEVSAARAAGIHVVVMGIFPFSDCSGCAFQAGWWASLESRRQTYNQWALAMYGPDFVDLSPWLKETTTARGDRRWLRDGLHLERIGAALAAEAFPVERLASPGT